MKYTDEQIDEFLNRMNVKFLPYQKELFKRLANGEKICISIPPRLGHGYFLEHLPKLMGAIGGEVNERSRNELNQN